MPQTPEPTSRYCCPVCPFSTTNFWAALTHSTTTGHGFVPRETRIEPHGVTTVSVSR